MTWSNPDFTNAKIGDKVFICGRGGWGLRRMAVAEIERVGKIHVTVRGQKYRFTGDSAGDPYHGDFLRPFEQKEWDEYQGEVAVHRARVVLRDFNWGNCDAELALKVYALLPKSRALAEGGEE